MKKQHVRPALALWLWIALLHAPFAQSPYFQQEVNYRIEVSLDDSLHTLTGHITFEYHNNSPDTLSEIWIHLWPNAYKNTRTAFCRQKLRNKNAEFYFAPEEKRGRIEVWLFRPTTSRPTGSTIANTPTLPGSRCPRPSRRAAAR